MEIKFVAVSENKTVFPRLNIADLISSGFYSVSTIKRKSDSKIFVCYARNGRIQMNKQCDKSWFIGSFDDKFEELELRTIDTNIYEVLGVIYDDFHNRSL